MNIYLFEEVFSSSKFQRSKKDVDNINVNRESRERHSKSSTLQKWNQIRTWREICYEWNLPFVLETYSTAVQMTDSTSL